MSATQRAMNIQRDPLVERFRLRVRGERLRRDEDQRAVEEQRLRLRASRDWLMGNADAETSEAAESEVGSES